MTTLRNQALRRRVITLILFLGLFAQFQLAFACEYKDGKLQLICCCDESGDMSKDCSQGGNCDNSAELTSLTSSNCCNISMHSGPQARSLGSPSHHQQILSLDAPQPPPTPILSEQSGIVPSQLLMRQSTYSPPTLTSIDAGDQIFRKTQRLRI